MEICKTDQSIDLDLMFSASMISARAEGWRTDNIPLIRPSGLFCIVCFWGFEDFEHLQEFWILDSGFELLNSLWSRVHAFGKLCSWVWSSEHNARG